MLKIICRYHLDCAPPVFEYRWVNITNRMGQCLRKGWVSISESGGSIQSESANQELAAVISELNTAKSLGFDTETRASFKVGEVYHVALLQLATGTDAYLIRLHGIKDFESIRNIFEEPSILKVGVAIRDDLKHLQKLFKFIPENFIELQSVAKEKGLKNMGLRGMTEEILQASLSKKAKISNWESKTLSADQILYAATDAWIGLMLYQKLTN